MTAAAENVFLYSSSYFSLDRYSMEGFSLMHHKDEFCALGDSEIDSPLNKSILSKIVKLIISNYSYIKENMSWAVNCNKRGFCGTLDKEGHL